MSIVNPALEASLRYLGAGFSVLPIKVDGSKSPDLSSWKEYQSRAPSETEVRDWHAASRRGVGIVCGEASKGFVVFDFEFSDYYEAWAEIIEATNPGLLPRLPVVKTPGKDANGGRHVYVLKPNYNPKDKKLAQMSRDEALRRAGSRNKITAIEVRVHGMQVLAPGCPAECHPSKRGYELLPGVEIEDTPLVTDDEVCGIESACVALNHVEQSAASAADAATRSIDREGRRPGDDFNRCGNWRDVLEPHGWKLAYERGGVGYWTRPGKSAGVSATTGYCKTDRSGDLLFPFSTNAEPLSVRAYSKFSAYSLLNFSGNHGEAAKALADAGYGEQTIPLRNVEENPSVIVEDIDPDETDLPGWPSGILPQALDDYAESLARSVACPVDFPATAMLAVAGSAIGATRAISVSRKWVESSRFFLAVVAEPGGGKSPALDAIMEPLTERQSRQHAEWDEAKEQRELDAEVYEAAKKAYLKQKAAGDEDVVEPTKPLKATYRHYYTTNATTEALIPMISENPRGFLMYMDEITGWVAGMNQYKAGGKGSDRQFWLSAWNGSPAKVDRKSGRENGPLISNRPFISVMGGVQPDMLSILSDERGREDGFVHRLLFVYPTDSPWPTTIGASPPQGHEKAWTDALEKIWGWTMELDAASNQFRPKLMAMAPTARQVADLWFSEHAAERNADGFQSNLSGPWSKMRAYFFRLALTIHCLRVACGEASDECIDVESVTRAGEAIEYFKKHARRVYGRLSCRSEDVKAERLIAWVKRIGGVATARDVMRAGFHKKSTDANAALAELVDRGLGAMEPAPPPEKGRQASPTFRANKSKDATHPTTRQKGTNDASEEATGT